MTLGTVRSWLRERIARTRRGGPACIVLADGPLLATVTADEAEARHVGVAAAIALDEHPPWEDLLDELDRGGVRPLLGFRRAVSRELSELLAARCPRAVVVLVGAAAARREGVLPTAELLRARGVLCAPDPAAGVEVCRLDARGITPSVTAVTPRPTDAEAAALLGDALRRAGVPVADRGGLELCGPEPTPGPGARQLRYHPARGAADADDAALRALAALCRSWGPDELLPGSRPRVRAASARERLDHWPRELLDDRVLVLVAHYGLHAPPWRSCRTASGAAAAARAIGLPVDVRAVAAALPANSAPVGTAVRAVTTISGTRQAYRDVVRACARFEPGAAVEGVIVHATATGRRIVCALDWTTAPLLLLHHGDRATALPCPASTALCRAVVGELRAWLRGPVAAPARVAAALRRLSWLGADLRERMVRMQLVLALTEEGPRVVAGRGDQNTSYRGGLF